MAEASGLGPEGWGFDSLQGHHYSSRVTMHISTHNDRIWQSGCQQQEDAVRDQLTTAGYNTCLVDAVQTDLADLPQPFASDNHFRVPVSYVNLAPEFWHIYRCKKLSDAIYPVKQYNVFMNRISGERLLLLYKLHEAELLDEGYVGFNCLYHDRDPDVAQRRANFDRVHAETGWHKWDGAHQQLRNKMPLHLKMDPDTAALASRITLVVETYVSDTVIAFSEKIFRSLQTPRPWVLFCSPGSIAVLRDTGFDVLDEEVDHSYDAIVDDEQRIDAILAQIQKPLKFNPNRYAQAVQTNQQLLDQLAVQWPSKLSHLLQSMSV